VTTASISLRPTGSRDVPLRVKPASKVQHPSVTPSPDTFALAFHASRILRSGTMTGTGASDASVFRGSPDEEGIPLSGRISGKSSVVQGNWVEHLGGISLEKGNHLHDRETMPH